MNLHRPLSIVLFSLSSVLFATYATNSHSQPSPDRPVDATSTASSSAPNASNLASTPAVPAEYVPTPATVRQPPFRPIAITLNLLPLIILRASINVEWAFAPHHALEINPFLGRLSVDSGSDSSGSKVEYTYTTVGGELGYRFYTGSKGAHGIGFGPFGTYASSKVDVKCSGSSSSSCPVTGDLVYYGGGVDVIGQYVDKNGITARGGLGIMYLQSEATVKTSDSTIGSAKVSGWVPRLLLALGYSF